MPKKTQNSPRSSRAKSPKKTVGNSAAQIGNVDDEEKETNGYKLGLKPPTDVELYFDVRDSSYWYQLHGRWICLPRAELVKEMRGLGLREKIYFDGQRECEWPLWYARQQGGEKMVDYAGALAGHKVGIFSDGSKRRYLVTEEASGVFTDSIPKSVKKSWPDEPRFFVEFIRQLLPEEQWMYFCHWLAIALRSLKTGDYRPGQVVFLAGEHGCGKSLLQSIVTEILGGRSGNPFPFMKGDTNFNSDFVGAEHWMIEDPRGSTRHPDRMELGARLKEGTVNETFWIHPKGKQAIGCLPLLRRITLSMNLETEYISVAPPFDTSFKEKAFLFLCSGSSDAPLAVFKQFREKSGELNRGKIKAAIREEIPHVREWLISSFKPSALVGELRDDRFGIRAWHHPTLLADLANLSYENRLLELIDEIYFSDEPPHTKVTKLSREILKDLRDKNAFEADKILRHPGACGSLLGKLAKSQPSRVEKNSPQNGNYPWTIFPPSQPNDKNQLVLGVSEFAVAAGTVAPAI